MKIKKIKKILHIVSIALFNVMAILFGITLIVNALLTDQNVSNLLTQFVFQDKPEDMVVNTGKAPIRYKTWYSSVEDILNGNGEIAWYAQKEGTVLLKNEQNALPLSAGEKVSLYGVTAYDPMYCLDGAGNNKINDPRAYNGKSEVYRRQFFYEEFEKVGLTMNESLEQWYNSTEGLRYRRADKVGFWGYNSFGYSGNDNGKVPALTEANWREIPDSSKDRTNFGKDSTAIFITGRMTNEMLDLNPEGTGSTATYSGGNNDGRKEDVDYLKFTADEKNLLTELGNNYDKVIVIFNQANAPQEDIPALLEECGIEAALWIGFPGSDGIKAVAEILTGEINPSGGLSAAWYTARNNNPSTQNYAISGRGQPNVVNMEGMYVGYRYAETRYEDTLLKSANAGSYDYGAQISYPFGYGLSYTTFDYTNVEIVKDENPSKNYYTCGLMSSNDPNHKCEYCDGEGNNLERPDEEKRATGANLGDCDDLIVRVTVRNTGTERSGREVVQIYLQQPITEQDKLHGVQKPAVQLIGYGKTSELAPDAEETIEIKIDANKWFAAYDSKLEVGGEVVGGYVLSEGSYYLAAARNSHEAVNSIYKSKGFGQNDAFNGEYGEGKAENVKTVEVSSSRSASYKYWTQGATDDVHNLFSDVAPNTDMVFSRYDWNKTAAIQSNGRIGLYGNNVTGDADGKTNNFDSRSSINSEQMSAYIDYYGVEVDETPYVFGWSNTEWKLIDLIGVEYDPARGASEEDVQKWKELVGQMSDKDFDLLFSKGLRKTLGVESIGKPATNDQNASNGFEWAFGLGDGDTSDGTFKAKAINSGFAREFDKNAKIAYPTGYPCEGIVAASFDNYVAYLVGQAIGEDALWGGTAGIYGFGLGLQRNPYHGRAGEFYSDDSFLTGMMGAYETKGAQEKGLYVYNKHFVLNDQDTDRTTYRAWIDEQTFRQIYLRPFEMAIEIGDAMNVMIAFNELGDAWTGSNYNLMTRWLRGEAGMRGFAISDYAGSEGENLGYGIISGACLLDGDVNDGYSRNANDARYNNRLVEAATRILYTVANSNAMNFYGDSTVTYTFDPLWYTTRDALLPAFTITVDVIFGLSCAFVVGMTAWRLVDKYIFKKED
ncbi:MAG: glycoside hydrolase family 3 C-terminal domain-containing protein [Clostridia bacterium]|nr:glycoside hydrolase family 3 C-terminal domain-containing protein [Clostridia bacterium]